MSFKTRFPELYQAFVTVSSTRNGLAPKSPADATKFLNGAATPAFAAVKDSDLSTSDVVTNNVDTTKHGFITKAPNDPSQFFRGDATWATAFPQITQGRLTLTTVTPVTTADVTAATTLYFTPYGGNRIAVYNGTNWKLYAFTEISIAVPASTSQMYDVFVFDNAGTLTLELLAWTNDTTRATALVLQDGVLVKSGATTRKYLGSVRTTTVSGQTEDSFAKRYVWNYYNRVRRGLRVMEATDSWSYTTNSFQQANASTANQLDVVVGVAEVLLQASIRVTAANSAGGNDVVVAIGEDSTTAFVTGCLVSVTRLVTAGARYPVMAELTKYPAIGRHFYAWLERSAVGGTTSWLGDDASPTFEQAGIHGVIEG